LARAREGVLVGVGRGVVCEPLIVQSCSYNEEVLAL